MLKTLTVRMDDATYRLIAEAAEADNRSVSNFIETAAKQRAIAEILVSDAETAEIRGNRTLVKRLKRGHQEAVKRQGRFV